MTNGNYTVYLIGYYRDCAVVIPVRVPSTFALGFPTWENGKTATPLSRLLTFSFRTEGRTVAIVR